MTQPTPAEQLLNLADRAERGQLTGDEAARLRSGIAKLHTRIDEYRDSRRRWMEAAYADRRCALEQQQRAERAEAAIERVRALHQPDPDGTPFPDGYQCGTCSQSCGDGYQYLIPWPCPTRAALDEHQEQQT